jgi:uncharacterized membrane protein (UPF0127 family)
MKFFPQKNIFSSYTALILATLTIFIVVIIGYLKFIPYNNTSSSLVTYQNGVVSYNRENILTNIHYDAEFKAILADGSTFNFMVQIADDDDERTVGMMFRDNMDESQGMLFVFPDNSVRSFWMKNTYIPLDIIFLDENMKIINVSRNAQPLDTINIHRSLQAAKYVLEINGGTYEKLNIKSFEYKNLNN